MTGWSSMWTILGIAPTTDIASIKSAYAAKAKESHPEEHPQEFQELQKAYKSAIKYAKQVKKAEMAGEVAAEQLPNEKSSKKTVKAKEDGKDIQEEPKILQIEQTLQEEVQTEPQEEDSLQQNMEFDYEKVDWETLEEQFFQEFLNIEMNPYLMNNTVAWKWFLEQKEYQELFDNDDFRKKMVRKMCYLSGWHKKTICFFDQWLQKYQSECNKETSNFHWKLKKYRIPNKSIFSVERWVTVEQKTMHEVILNQVKKQGDNGQLQDERSVANYIRLYLQYAAANHEQIYKQYEQNRTGRLAMKSMLIGFVIVAGGMILGYTIGNRDGITSGKSSAQQQMQERNEKYNQERMENLKKYNEQLQEQILQTIPAEEAESSTESAE